MKKYELTDETMYIGDRILHRIRALIDFDDVLAKDLGGWIETEENLSHEGLAWVYEGSHVFGNARVYENARVYDANVYGNAQVFGNARVADANVYGNACVYENACVRGESSVYGNALIFGSCFVGRYAEVRGDARICGNARVYNATISGNAKIERDKDYLYVRGFNGKFPVNTFFKNADGCIYTVCGTFEGNLSEFEAEVRKIYGNSDYTKMHLSLIEAVKFYFS